MGTKYLYTLTKNGKENKFYNYKEVATFLNLELYEIHNKIYKKKNPVIVFDGWKFEKEVLKPTPRKSKLKLISELIELVEYTSKALVGSEYESYGIELLKKIKKIKKRQNG